jgi:hypothetical protein
MSRDNIFSVAPVILDLTDGIKGGFNFPQSLELSWQCTQRELKCINQPERLGWVVLVFSTWRRTFTFCSTLATDSKEFGSLTFPNLSKLQVVRVNCRRAPESRNRVEVKLAQTFRACSHIQHSLTHSLTLCLSVCLSVCLFVCLSPRLAANQTTGPPVP